jgi:heme exporter protein CcmD
MTHAAFVLPAYALGALVPAGFAVQAMLRLRRARRRLAVLEPDRRRA